MKPNEIITELHDNADPAFATAMPGMLGLLTGTHPHTGRVAIKHGVGYTLLDDGTHVPETVGNVRYKKLKHVALTAP